MRFFATKVQVAQIAANAVNASRPVGMGLLHFEAREYKPEEFRFGEELAMDYVQGRQVKLCVRKVVGDQWEIAGGGPSLDYQSWSTAYPTYEKLIESGGGRLMDAKIYLSDGAYAEFTGWSIVVTAENGIEATDAVTLDGPAIAKLIAFAKSKGFETTA